jgi:hypothetical protein
LQSNEIKDQLEKAGLNRVDKLTSIDVGVVKYVDGDFLNEKKTMTFHIPLPDLLDEALKAAEHYSINLINPANLQIRDSRDGQKDITVLKMSDISPIWTFELIQSTTEPKDIPILLFRYVVDQSQAEKSTDED